MASEKKKCANWDDITGPLIHFYIHWPHNQSISTYMCKLAGVPPAATHVGMDWLCRSGRGAVISS